MSAPHAFYSKVLAERTASRNVFVLLYFIYFIQTFFSSPYNNQRWVQYDVVWLSSLQTPANGPLEVLSAIAHGTISEDFIMNSKISHHWKLAFVAWASLAPRRASAASSIIPQLSRRQPPAPIPALC